MEGEAIASGIITLREGVEAILLTAIIYSVLKKTGKIREARLLVGGALGSGVVGSLLAIAMIQLLGARGMHPLVEAAVSAVAVAVILWAVGWSASHAKATAESAKGLTGLAALFAGIVIVGREAVETILMLAPLSARAASATLMGAGLGLLLAAGIGAVFLFASRLLPLRHFFLVSGILLTLIAGGLAGYAAHEIVEYSEEAGFSLGPLAAEVYSIELPSDHPLSDEAPLGVILQVLFGIRLEAEVASILAQTLVLAAGFWLIFRD